MVTELERLMYKELVGDFSPQALFEGDGDSLENDIVLDVGENDLVLTVTESEYIQILSALINGVITTYPQTWMIVLYPYIKAAKLSNLLCAKIEACIGSTPSLQQTITNVSVSNYTYPATLPVDTPEMDNRFPPAQRSQSTSSPPAGCDKDVLWAGILEQVNRLNLMCIDVLEQIISEADKAERIARAIALIPFFGDLAGEVVIAIAEESENLRNAYVAHVTQEVLEDIACDLFDMVCAECRYPTFDEVLDHYANLGITGMDDWANIGYTAIVDLLLNSSGLANLVVFFTVNTSVLVTLYLGGAVLGRRGSKWLNIWNLLGEDFPSTDWEILCDACEPDYCYNFDFLATDGDFYRNPSRLFGVWLIAVGWLSEWGFTGVWDERLYVWRDCEIETSIKKVTIALDVTGTLGSSPTITLQVLDQLFPMFSEAKSYTLGTQEIEWDLEDAIFNSTQIRITIVAGAGAEHQIDITMTSVKVEGEGDNPFDVPDNC